MDKSNVIVINNQIMPYRIPLFNQISQEISYNITVFYCSQRAQDRQWTLDTSHILFNYNILRNWSVKLSKSSFQDEWRFIRINPTLLIELKKLKPILIIAYEYSLPTLFALIYAKLTGCKLMIWSEMTTHADRSLGRGQEWMRRLIIPHIDGFIGTSHAACDNFRRRGIEDDKIFLAPQTYDAQKFCHTIEEISHPPTVIYVGYLSERKGVRHLVQAFAQVVSVMPSARLMLVGTGHEQPYIETIINDNQLGENVTLTGFVEPQDIPQYYGQGDVFVLPSLEDTFGVVATEAIAAGLTLICSPFAGFASHMTHGEDGLVIDPTQHNDLAQGMIELLSNPEMRQQLNTHAQTLLPQFKPENVAGNFVNAIHQTLNGVT